MLLLPTASHPQPPRFFAIVCPAACGREPAPDMPTPAPRTLVTCGRLAPAGWRMPIALPAMLHRCAAAYPWTGQTVEPEKPAGTASAAAEAAPHAPWKPLRPGAPARSMAGPAEAAAKPGPHATERAADAAARRQAERHTPPRPGATGFSVLSDQRPKGVTRGWSHHRHGRRKPSTSLSPPEAVPTGRGRPAFPGHHDGARAPGFADGSALRAGGSRPRGGAQAAPVAGQNPVHREARPVRPANPLPVVAGMVPPGAAAPRPGCRHLGARVGSDRGRRFRGIAWQDPLHLSGDWQSGRYRSHQRPAARVMCGKTLCTSDTAASVRRPASSLATNAASRAEQMRHRNFSETRMRRDRRGSGAGQHGAAAAQHRQEPIHRENTRPASAAAARAERSDGRWSRRHAAICGGVAFHHGASAEGHGGPQESVMARRSGCKH